MRVLLNGINALSAGGKQVISNIIKSITKIAPDIKFDVVLPYDQGFEHWNSTSNMKIHLKRSIGNRAFVRFVDLHYNISNWCRKYGSDVCFTLGDIGPIHLDIPHIVLLQQAMILYKNETYEKFWSLKDKIKFYYMRRYFGKMSQHVDIVTVQSPIMAERLRKVYNVPNSKIKVITSTLPGEYNDLMINKYNARMISIDKPCRLLFLSAGYPHKNHAILPKVATEIKNRRLNNKIHIFLTLDDSNRYTQKLIKAIAPFSNCISNLGKLSKDEVPGAYKAANALFIPTLVESFGLIYLEAMKYKCPIMTSDRDFSRWMCGDLAMYFDPHNATSIVNTIMKFIDNSPPERYDERAIQRLSHFPVSWKKVGLEYLRIISNLYVT